ncbi:MAG: nicotinate phosphoribosyltransferase [Proteobacteria bacterium]|nr:nicotinate phosphoribosyltransferase [Pseudomonadota bacterium]
MDELTGTKTSPSLRQEKRPILDHSLLLSDLYQLSMLEVYRAEQMNEIAVFELFVRKLPVRRGFLMAAGLEQLLEFLEGMSYRDEELDWLRSTGMFSAPFIDRLKDLRFTGDVDALPEGTIFFADEPVVRVTAPLPEAQLVETRLINLIHLQTVVASTAARMRLAAPGKQLIDFGFRRAHGAEAGLLAARASYLAGFDGSATVAAGRHFGIPIFGTMAHSFVQAHDDEAISFERFARARPKALTLLIDTYDTEQGARRVAELAPRLAADGIAVRAVRIDSGDLAAHARAVRSILDRAGLSEIKIMASGGLDETALLSLCSSGAPIDGFGVGTSLTTAAGAPALDCAYKLQEYAGRPRRKLSEGKATWPGRKQVYRRYRHDGAFQEDTVALLTEAIDGDPLLRPAMRGGRRVAGLPNLEGSRALAASQLQRLPEPHRALGFATYPVHMSRGLTDLANSMTCSMRQP